MTADPIVIAAAVRTPLGRFLGDLSPLPAHALGAHVIRAALDRAGSEPERRFLARRIAACQAVNATVL